MIDLMPHIDELSVLIECRLKNVNTNGELLKVVTPIALLVEARELLVRAQIKILKARL